MSCDTLLAYPVFNEEFKIHTNASDFQLEAVIIQKGKSIAFYNIKLTYAHKMYTVKGKDLLGIVEALK